MDSVLATAIEKLVSKMKTQINSGTYQIDEYITLHVEAEVKKHEDEDYIGTVKIPKDMLLLYAMSIMGFQKFNFEQIVNDFMDIYLQQGEAAFKEILSKIKNLDEIEKRYQENIKERMPLQKRTGKTVVKGSIQVVPNNIRIDKAV